MSPSNPRLTWFLTYPQNDATKEYLLEKLKLIDTISEYVIATELHEDGHQHLHAYVKFQTGVSLTKAPVVFHVLAKTGNYQPVRSCKNVIRYCTKESDFISNINIKSLLGKRGKLTVDTIKSKTVAEALIADDIGINSIRNYILARSILLPKYTHPTERGIWIYGNPRSGKSTAVLGVYPDCYLKIQNKWFDGYDGQPVILLDDFDVPCLASYLKQWLDWKACTAEVKGATINLQHRLFIITSNYVPRQLFLNFDGTPKQILCEAIESRCKFIHKVRGVDISDQLVRADRFPMEGGAGDKESHYLEGWSMPKPNITN